MAKQQSPKPQANKGSNDERKNGKARKKNPKPNNVGATGKTIGGYNGWALHSRQVKRDAFYHLALGDAAVLKDSNEQRTN